MNPMTSSRSSASRGVLPRLVLAACVASLAACAGLPERNVPEDVAAELPGRFDDVLPATEAEVSASWWRAFNDPVLDALVERGLEHNSDLIIGAARLREARAVLRQTRADQIPDVGVFVGGSRARSASPLVPGQTAVGESGSYGVQAGFEVDLWGRLAAQTEAARQRYLAQGYTQAALRLTIAAELVRGYLQAQSLAVSQTILADNVVVLEDALRLSNRRYELGAISELDLQSFNSQVEDSRAQLASTRQQYNATRRALLVLAGEMPTQTALAALEVRSEAVEPSALPSVPLGLPSALLERRPDIRAAEADLAAANADLTVARRALLPSLSLTGSAGEASSDLSELFDNSFSVWSIGAELLATIFDGGRRRGAIEAADARREAVVETYRDTVRESFREVLDALDARTAAVEVHRARAAQAAALDKAVNLSQRRYDEGYSDYLGVLDARRTLLQARLAVADAERAAGAAYVDLALALGGGWDGVAAEASTEVAATP